MDHERRLRAGCKPPRERGGAVHQAVADGSGREVGGDDSGLRPGDATRRGISPLLANRELHEAFDLWRDRNCPTIWLER